MKDGGKSGSDVVEDASEGPDVRWEHEMVHVSQAEGKRNQAEALLQDARRRVAAAFWFL